MGGRVEAFGSLSCASTPEASNVEAAEMVPTKVRKLRIILGSRGTFLRMGCTEQVT